MKAPMDIVDALMRAEKDYLRASGWRELVVGFWQGERFRSNPLPQRDAVVQQKAKDRRAMESAGTVWEGF